MKVEAKKNKFSPKNKRNKQSKIMKSKIKDQKKKVQIPTSVIQGKSIILIIITVI